MQTCELHNSTGPLIKTVSRETMLKLPDGKYPIIDGSIVADRVTYYLNEGRPHQFVFSIAPSKVASAESADSLSYVSYAKYTTATKSNTLTLVVTNG